MTQPRTSGELLKDVGTFGGSLGWMHRAERALAAGALLRPLLETSGYLGLRSRAFMTH